MYLSNYLFIYAASRRYTFRLKGVLYSGQRHFMSLIHTINPLSNPPPWIEINAN